jgi:penicillin-binding protein 1A
MLPMGTRRWLALAASLAVVGAACSYTADLRLPNGQAESTKVYAADGSLLTTLHAEENRDPVKLDDVAPVLRDAVVAIEDSRFFEHEGVDPRGLARALKHDAESGTVAEGGSTITQQYVRAVMLDRDRTVSRKLREAVRAMQIEHKYSKKTILERYLNTVYFGNGAYGVEAASQLYFGRASHDLDLPQAALLAGLIQAPEHYNPYQSPAAALTRRNVVLDRLLELGKAPAAAVAAARATPLGVGAERPPDRYPAAHFVEQVKRLILSDKAFGETPEARQRLLLAGGLRIQTTLDPRLQALAEQAVTRVLTKPGSDPTAAVVSLDVATGHVLAYVGGPDFFGATPYAKVDLADPPEHAGARGRSAGSAFKPFVLATALQEGVPLTRTYNAPGSLTLPLPGQPPWEVHNYDGHGGGRMSLVDATVNSVNTVYAQLVLDVGSQHAVDLATQLGIRSRLQAVPSAVLGTNGVTALDMASAYSSFAGDGLHADPVFVTKVTKNDGTVLFDTPTQRHRVLPAFTARRVTNVLQKVVESGTGINARIGRPVAGKTGTAEKWSDAWFVGYTPELVTAVWVGFPDASRSMTPPATRITVTGATWPAAIWQLYQGAALAETPASQFPRPEDAEQPSADASSTSSTGSPGLLSVLGMNATDATRLLTDAGYQVRAESQPSREYPPGTVVAQSPPAGRALRRGATVRITVASGPPARVVVPPVLGLSADQAATALRAIGLAVDVVVQQEPPPGDPSRRGRIWKQAPLAGGSGDAGSAVIVWVNPA